MQFEGKKFFTTGSEIITDCFGYKFEKPIFGMTKSYIKFLNEKERLRKQRELLALKHKLDYQYEKFGEVDQIDYNQYVFMLTQSQSSTSKPTSKSKICRQVVVTSQQR